MSLLLDTTCEVEYAWRRHTTYMNLEGVQPERGTRNTGVDTFVWIREFVEQVVERANVRIVLNLLRKCVLRGTQTRRKCKNTRETSTLVTSSSTNGLAKLLLVHTIARTIEPVKKAHCFPQMFATPRA